MWNALAALVLLAADEPERVTFTSVDGVALVADFHDLAGAAPTVICLPMYGSTRDSYATLAAPLRAVGIQMLALDLRGHGESAPELVPKVEARDAELFGAMYQDVAAALALLRARGEDTSRVALLGASVGCSIGIDAIVRDPSAFRSIALLSPGAKYLGLDTLAHLERWPDVPALVLTSSEEQANAAPIVELLEADAPAVTEQVVCEGEGLHGTSMFGAVPDVEARLVGFYRATLLHPALAIPRFEAGDPRAESPGFVALTLRVSRARKVPDQEETYVLMAFAVGDTLTIGAMTKQPFAGVVRIELGERAIEATWDSTAKGDVAFASTGDDPLELAGAPGAFRGTSWVNVELPIADWLPNGEAALRLTFEPAAGAPIALPGGDAPYRAYFAER